MKCSLQFFITLVFFTLPKIHAQIYSFEETPKWVKYIEIPNESEVSKYDITSGYYLKLVDKQVFLENNSTFYREVRNIVSYSGITHGSQLSVTYDTSYQYLRIHHLIIWRNGKKIDRTGELGLELLNNEYNLDQGIYTGKITVHAILNDIRKNDLIDFAYTMEGENPIFNNEKYLFEPLESIDPVDLFTIRILYPEEEEYLYKCTDCDSINISETVINGYKVIELTNKNLTAFKYEDYTPGWVTPYKYFTLSSFYSWKDVNRWAQGVFNLKEEPDLKVVFEEILNGGETTDEKINKIINYVQNDVRYMGIETGIGSIKPFPPEQVVNQRFGDCKDKSLLLVELLKDIGVNEAYPVLVNTVAKHNVDVDYPNNQIFNHCIVNFNIDSISYWIDPTITSQGGNYKDLFTHNYGKALVVGVPGDSLTVMPTKKDNGGATIIEEFNVKSFKEPVQLKIVSKRCGYEADVRRALFEYYSTKDLFERVEDDLKLRFPLVKESKDIEIFDDVDSNIVVVIYNYEIENFWVDGSKESGSAINGYWSFKFEPRIIYQNLRLLACEDREFDYEINYPFNLNYRVIFNFSEEMLAYDDADIYENDALYFKEKVEQLSSKSVQLDYYLRIKKPYIKADEYKKICEEINVLVNNLPTLVYFPK